MLNTALTLLTICFFGRMTPGPDMMLLIRHSGNRNHQSNLAAYACMAGICLGLMVHVSLSVFGLALVIKSNPVIFQTLRYAGAVYLLYIGWQCLTGDSHMDISGDGVESVQGLTIGQGFREGLFCNLLNPKVTIFILSVFMQLISPDATLSEKLVYGGIIIGEAIVGWGSFVFFLHTPFMQRFYANHSAKIGKVTGVIILALGGAVFVTG